MFDPLDVLAEISAHIPDVHENTPIFSGWYSNRTRGYRKQQGRLGTAGAVAPSPGAKEPAPLEVRRSWARLIRQVDAAEPLVCLGCGASINVLAVIDNTGGICRILSQLNLRSSGGQATGPSSEGTKPGIRLLDADALQIVHGTIPCPALTML